MNVALVVEGATDESAYPRLIHRIWDNAVVSQVRACGGKSKLKNGFVAHLKEFQRNNAWRIDAAFVIRDSDCLPPAGIEQQLAEVLDATGFAPDFAVEFFVTPCMLESWLLSDTPAIGSVAADRGTAREANLQHIEITPQPSADDDETFVRVLSRFGLPATPAVYGDVAARADLSLIERRCGYFREFRRRVALH